ncbi:MAG: nitroreductase [Candidatus Omnitrophica bacterium]|nr:nitroreductase [Candidatus Omnitrophota bacterium]
MNQVIENIEKRRSVRSYESKPVPKDILSAIIEAGNCAPSGCNAQDWRFVVIQDREFRKKLAGLALIRYKKWMEKAPEQLKEMRKDIDAVQGDPVYYSAPVVLFVIGSGMTTDYDSPMVCQNIMLAARSFGIGSCWVYFGQLVLDDLQVRKELDLKQEEKVYGPIILGYPKGDFPEPPPKNPPSIKWI